MTSRASAAAVRPAGAADHSAVMALVSEAGLPAVGIPADLEGFTVAEHLGRIVGCAGLERHSEHGLLRSLAVSPAVQHLGLGAALVRRAVATSRARGDLDCWLMTATARDWFPRFGFVAEPRGALPRALEGAIDYHGVCPSSATMMRRESGPPVRVLVLCTGNSARSQVGEALFTTLGGAMIVAASAGSRPAARVNPAAVQVLADHGIAWGGGTPKQIDTVARQPWDLVITVCDAAREACPILPGAGVMAHWGLPDPADLEPPAARMAAFEAVCAALHASVRALLDRAAVSPSGGLSYVEVQALAP